MKPQYKPENADDWQALEEQLRAASPPLPASLRDRTLSACALHCAGRADTIFKQRQRGSQRLVWALTGLCLFQWVVVSVLDSKQAALIETIPSSRSASSGYSHRNRMAKSPNDPHADLWGILQARSHAFATLLAARSEQETARETG